MNAKMRAVWAAAYADALWRDPRDIKAALRLEGPQTPYTIAAEWADHAVRTLAHTTQGRKLLAADPEPSHDVETVLASILDDFRPDFDTVRVEVEKLIGRPLRSNK